MVAWEQKTLADLLPSELTSLVSSASSVASTVGGLISDVGTVVSDLSALVIDFLDPIEAASKAVIDEINNFVTDIKNTGVFMLVIPPPAPLFSSEKTTTTGSIVVTTRQVALVSLGSIEKGDSLSIEDGTTRINIVVTGVDRLTNSVFFDPVPSLPATIPPGAIVKKHASAAQGVDLFINKVQESFFDIGDANRPVFTSSALIGGVVVLVGGPTLQGLSGFTNKLGNVFSIQEFKDLFRALNEKAPIQAILQQNITPSTQPQNISVSTVDGFLPLNGAIIIDNEIMDYESADDTAGFFINVIATAKHQSGAIVLPSKLSYQGEKPDWRNQKVTDIFPAIGTLLNQLERFTKQVAGAPRASDVVSDFAQILLDKASQLTQIATAMSAILTQLASDFDATGINLLKIPEGVGGNNRFISELTNSTNKPPLSDNAFTAGVVLLGGAGVFTVLETFF